MKKIRRGNDILITWTIKRGEEAEVFPENTSVFLHASDGSCVPIDVGFVGNVATINYRGRNQSRLGEYRLLLVENNGGDDMVTLDHTPAFVLVERSALAGGEDDTITTEVVELTDTLELSQGGGGTTDYNDLANKPAINGVTLVGNKTSSDLSILTEQQLEEGLATKQDTIEDLDEIREGASAGATAVQPSALNNYATKSELQTVEGEIPSVTDNVTSTSAEDALSAKQGKLLNDRINNVATRGRFLSLWNCVTGMPLTNPSGYPYTYQTGDFFIVNQTGDTNYMPSGSTYIGQPSTTIYSGAIKVNDTIFYDGTSWSVFDTPAGSGDVQDVYVNGISVISNGIAYILVPTDLADFESDATHRTVTDTEKSTWNGKLTSHDFAISPLASNTTSFSFPANQRCYQKVSIAASATLSFAVENIADNYIRVYNSGGSEITLAIGTVTHNNTAVSAKVGPAEIKCGAGKYIEISVIYDGSDATFTASEDLQILN